MSRIGDWGEREYIHVYRRGSASRFLDQLTSHPGNFDTLQELMDITLELYTRYHERQKENGGNKEKKPHVSVSNSSRPPQGSSSKRPHHRKNKKGKQSQASKDKPHAAPLHKDNKSICSEKKDNLLIVAENIQLKNSSRDLRTSLDHQETSLASRENLKWGS
ncbi:hypothetical protein O181_123554 [Austropuccinia psidii MF-1]|uniref:Uncharacterized protein n=1 Tax=Austropuccinia psidii MF-1 TaxID=1389203 RepID=A0A9Q3KQ93_9BASI|nr:hypothetical protein [Austropuccinia psidii MF-1]